MFRKKKAEVQEDSRRKNSSRDVAEIDYLIEGVQLAGEMEAEKNKRSQAQHIKVNRSWRADPSIVDKQPDQQVGHAHRVLVINRPVNHHLADDDLCRELDRAPAQHVIGFSPDHDVLQASGNIDGFVNRSTGYL